jgi:hypothetical protein
MRIVSLLIVVFMVFIQRYRIAGNVWVSFLFPALGRTLWAMPICFMIVAGSTKYSGGEELKLEAVKQTIFNSDQFQD